MRNLHRLTAGIGSMFLVAAVGFAVADDTSKSEKKHEPMKAVSQPFLDSLVGTWTTESTATHEGKQFKGTGKATYARAIGNTAIIQNYENSGPGPDGKTMTFFGHGVNRLSDDGKTLTVYWFCNMYPDPMKLSGPISDSGIELSGESPQGQAVTISFTKSADGITFKMKEGENEMTDVYKRAGAREASTPPSSR
jgi:hypothetical protein